MRRMILAGFLLSATVFGWDFNYSATLTGQPTWTRPVQDLSGLSFIGLSVSYQVQSFVAPATGVYTFLSTATSPANWDNFLVLYRNAFNPNAPLTNAVAANDDLNNNIANIGRSGFSTTLTAGINYFLVTTAFSTFGSVGSFTNGVSTTATVGGNLTATPEPGTWLMVAFGIGTLLLRRRLLPAAPGPSAPSTPSAPEDAA